MAPVMMKDRNDALDILLVILMDLMLAQMLMVCPNSKSLLGKERILIGQESPDICQVHMASVSKNQ